MRIGQSLWSREDFNLNNPTSSLLFTRTTSSKSFLKLQSESESGQNSEINPQDNDEENLLPHGNLINSSKKLLSNKLVRNRIYEQQQYKAYDGTLKTIYYFRATNIAVDDTGPFWPMAFPIKHPTPTFSSYTRNNKKYHFKEYYYLHQNPFSGTNGPQTYDHQPALQKYSDTWKHSVLIYDMDKSPRQQQPKIFDSEHICPSLVFESRFEGGNLRQVKRVGQFEYELILRPDLYTRRHTQWYYFRVQNMIANITYRFRIINLVKRSSLYSEGMQILLFSDTAAKRELRGWHRVGHHINYAEYRQRNFNALLERDINYFELDFQLEFVYTGDTCYIAHCYPYTFTDLKDDLDYLSSIRPADVFRRDILCESQAGNSCFIVTVTDESIPIHQKKVVFITARIHPGETNSSYMMRGLLEFITSDDKTAKKLRSQLIFKIIPMLNPDGVIIGNYRCSLTGKDMNRNFRHPRKQTFPTIFHMKELMQTLQKEQHEILAFCDLHGHSRKSNVFAYGCDGCDGPQPDMKKFLNARVLPYIMSRTAPEMFAFDYCKFHIHRCKESTGRVVMWKEMLIQNSFTLEASFAGSSIVEKPCHFNIQDYEKFGQHICESLRQYLDILSDTTRLDSILLDITKNVLRKLGKEKIPRALIPSLYPGEKFSNEPTMPINSVNGCIQALTECQNTINEQAESSSSDSDSDPEGGELPDIPFQKEDQELDAEHDSKHKKKLKKKRSGKIVDERNQKGSRKREVAEESNGNNHNKHITGSNSTNNTNTFHMNHNSNIADSINVTNSTSGSNSTTANSSNTVIDSIKITTGTNSINVTNSTNNTGGTNDTQHQTQSSQPVTSENDMNSAIKLTLAVDQMDKTTATATRTIPNRGPAFVSKYANRTGHGLPIFTTERALERKQKNTSLLQESQLERELDDEDTDAEQGISYSPQRSQIETTSIIDQNSSLNQTGKRTAAFVYLPFNDLSISSNDQSLSTISGTHVTQTPIFKALSHRRIQHNHRHYQQPPTRLTNWTEIEQNQSLSPSMLTLPNLMDTATRISPLSPHPSSMNNIETSVVDLTNRYAYETQTDSNGVHHHRLHSINDNHFRSPSKTDSSTIRASPGMSHKMPAVNNHHTHNRRSPTQKTNTYFSQQPLSSVDSTVKDRSMIITNETVRHPDTTERVNQLLKQYHVQTEKHKRS